MSAWVVSKTHIDLLITAGLDLPSRNCQGHKLSWYMGEHTGELDHVNADLIGGKLWAENYASVNERYPEAEAEGSLPGPIDFEGSDTLTYTFTRIRGVIDPVVVIKAIKCYRYQSCEHDGWEKSEAKVIVDSLMEECISLLPGYDTAPWEFDEPDYFTSKSVSA